MTCFTYLWTDECRRKMIASGSEGEPLAISAGSAFTKRGVRKGDLIYVLCVHDGTVFLIGRMKVARIMDREQYDAEFNCPDLWEGDEVIVGEQGTPMRMNFAVASEILESLTFDSHGKRKGLVIRDGKLAEPQSLRSVRELYWESVGVLDKLLCSEMS